jgi:hypothetical protein
MWKLWKFWEKKNKNDKTNQDPKLNDFGNNYLKKKDTDISYGNEANKQDMD